MPRAIGVKSLREAKGNSTWLRMWRKDACWPRAEWEWVADASRKAAVNPYDTSSPHGNPPLNPRRCRHNARLLAACGSNRRSRRRRKDREEEGTCSVGDCDSEKVKAGGGWLEFEQEFGSVAEQPLKRRRAKLGKTELRNAVKLSESQARSEKNHTEVKLNSFIKQCLRYPNTAAVTSSKKLPRVTRHKNFHTRPCWSVTPTPSFSQNDDKTDTRY
jgi:hypothetical protein